MVRRPSTVIRLLMKSRSQNKSVQNIRIAKIHVWQEMYLNIFPALHFIYLKWVSLNVTMFS